MSGKQRLHMQASFCEGVGNEPVFCAVDVSA